MIARRTLLSLWLSLALAVSSISVAGGSTELADAELRYAELAKTYEINDTAIKVLFPRYEAAEQECIDRLITSNNPSEVAIREGCKEALAKFQAERQRATQLLVELKEEMTTLESRIQLLKSPNSAGRAPISSGASTPSTGSTSSTVQPTPTPLASVSPQVSPNPIATASPSAIPSASAPTQITATPAGPTLSESVTAASTSKSPTPSNTLTPAATQKITPSPKATAKKRTITCVKGKTVRKVTAVKPVCPKGFKVQRKSN